MKLTAARHIMLTSLLLLATAQMPTELHVTVDGVDREALVFAPTGTGKVPLIFGYHGHTGTMRNASRSFGLQNAWPEALVVYPQGLPTKSHYDPAGNKSGWSSEDSNDNRDIKFFDALYAKLIDTYPVDTHHVFAMGHSNGAQFMYYLWSLRGSKFTAFGSAEGSGGQSVALSPKPFFITIGSRDPLVPPALQHRSLDAVFKVDGSSRTGTPYGEKGTLYSGSQPVVLWAYDGGHKFPEDCIPTMIKFFQSL